MEDEESKALAGALQLTSLTSVIDGIARQAHDGLLAAADAGPGDRSDESRRVCRTPVTLADSRTRWRISLANSQRSDQLSDALLKEIGPEDRPRGFVVATVS